MRWNKCKRQCWHVKNICLCFLCYNWIRIIALWYITCSQLFFNVNTSQFNWCFSFPGTDHLRNAIITNFDQIVSKLSQTHLIRVAFIQLLKERDILKKDIEDETEIGNVLVFVMKKGMNAMLHIVDVLHALELEDLADLIICFQNTSYRCTAGKWSYIYDSPYRKQLSISKAWLKK